MKTILAAVILVVSLSAHAQTCSYTISPSDLTNLPAAGGPATVTVTAPVGCPVTATSFQSWVVVANIVTTGSTTAVSLQIVANSGGARATSIVLAERLFLVSQVAATVPNIPALDPLMLLGLSLFLAAVGLYGVRGQLKPAAVPRYRSHAKRLEVR